MGAFVHEIRLKSLHRFGRRAPPGPLGELLRCLPRLVRGAVLMAIVKRSRLKNPPEWVSAAADIRLVDYAGQEEDTILQLEAPQLGKAASALYVQKEFWPTLPAPEDTCMDLLADILNELSVFDRDSEHFDRNLLHQLTTFYSRIQTSFEAIEISGRRYPQERPVRVDQHLLETVHQISARIPEAQRVRVVGTLDMIRASTRSCAIRLLHGQEVPCVLLKGDVRKISGLLTKPVLVLGWVQYKPSGRVLRIDAEDIRPAQKEDIAFWSRLPSPQLPEADLTIFRYPQGPRSGVAAVLGHWPGNETDEEINAWLREIS